MSWIKRLTQHLGALILPSVATGFFLGLAVYEHGVLRVFRHLFQNIILLTPRIPNTIGQIWNERKALFDSNHLGYTIVALVVGMPFVVLFVLLDDYEE